MTTLQPTTDSTDEAAPTRGGLRQWIIDHDDSWLFVALYIGLAVVLSIWISLFWLVAVVAGHGVLEWIRQRHYHSDMRGVVVRVLWELKLDIALVLLAFVVTVYMEVVLGMAGLGSAARLGVAGGARFVGWQRAIRGVLLSLDDVAQLGRAALKGGTTNGEAGSDAIAKPALGGGWTRKWAFGDWLSIGLGLFSIALLLVCTWLTDHTFATMTAEILHELHPLPPAEP